MEPVSAPLLRDVAALPDPVGEVLDGWVRPNGLEISRVRVPIGVIGIIYESRPNVTADAAGLCLKAGNACILRGGSEALHSNQAIAACVRAGLKAAGLPEAAVQVVGTADRAAVGQPFGAIELRCREAFGAAVHFPDALGTQPIDPELLERRRDRGRQRALHDHRLRRARHVITENARTQAAASSRASGIPPTKRHRRTTAGRSSGRGAKPT